MQGGDDDEIVVLESAGAKSLDELTADERELYFEILCEHAQRRGSGLPFSLASVISMSRMNYNVSQNDNPIVSSAGTRPRNTIPELILREIMTVSAEIRRTVTADIYGGDNDVVTMHGRPQIAVPVLGSGLRVMFDWPAEVVSGGRSVIVPAGENTDIGGIMIREFSTTVPDAVPGLSARLRSGANPRILREGRKYGSMPSPEILGRAVRGEAVFDFGPQPQQLLEDVLEYVHNVAAALGSSTGAAMELAMGARGVGRFSDLSRPFGRDTMPAPKTPSATPGSPAAMFGEISPGIGDGVAAIMDLNLRGLSAALFYANSKGVDSSEVRKEFASYRARINRRKVLRDIELKADADKMISAQLIAIAAEKFGSARAAEIRRNLSKPDAQGMGILTYMNPAERKPVSLTYETAVKKIEAAAANRCEHLAAYRKLRGTSDIYEMKWALTDLKKFFAKPADGQIPCNKCGFDVICPHVVEMTELEIRAARSAEYKAAMARYAEPNKFRGVFYCKICGEIVKYEEEYPDAATAVVMDDDIRADMFGEIIYLTRHLKFNKPVDPTEFTSGVRDHTYQFIHAIDREISKSRTISAEHARQKKRLYIAIYALAYFIHVASSGLVEFRGVKASGKSAVVDMIKHAIGIVMEAKAPTIKQLGIAGDVIKGSLVEAYKMLTGVNTPVVTLGSNSENVFTAVLLDPIYRWYYNASVIGSGKPRRSRADFVDQFDVIMGGPLSAVERRKALYDGVSIPAGFVAACRAVKYRPLGELRARSLERMHTEIQKKLVLEPVYEDAATGKVTESRMREPYLKSEETSTELQTLDRQLTRKITGTAAHGYTTRFRGPRAAVAVTPLGRIYDELGRKHVWNKFLVMTAGGPADNKIAANVRPNPHVSRNGGADPVVADKDECAKLVAAGGRVIDKVCGVCGVSRKDSVNISAEKIKAAMAGVRISANVAEYFMVRCPEGGLHADGCERCGRTEPPTAEWIEKYRAKYVESLITVEEAVAEAPSTKKEWPELEKFSHDFAVVTSFAEKVGVSYKALAAIGGIERADYTAVVSGAYIPPATERSDDPRLAIMEGYVLEFAAEYNQIRHYSRILKPHWVIADVFDKSGFNRAEAQRLLNLPELPETAEKMRWMRAHRKPRDALSYCLQTLCTLGDFVLEVTDEISAALRSQFVKSFFARIVRSDSLYSRAGYFSWAVLYGDTKGEIKESFDADTADNDVGVPEKDYVNEPFQNNFDLDIDPDDDPEDANGLHVGENLGLD